MTVKELKELLNSVADDALIVVAGGDHDYRPAGFVPAKATLYHDGGVDEFHGEENTFHFSPHKIIDVLVIGDGA